MTRKTTNALATLRQLAALGLPPAMIFGDLVACLRDIVAFETAQIILLNPDGSARDMMASKGLPAEVSRRYLEHWFNREEARFYPTHRRLQADPGFGVVRVSDHTPDFAATEIYQEIFSHWPVAWIALLVCRDGNRPVGNLGLGRPGDQSDFTAAELRSLEEARPLVARALAVGDGPPARDEAVTVEQALLVADASGVVLSQSANAGRLLRWSRGLPVDQPSFEDPGLGWAGDLLSDLAVRTLEDGGQAAERSANAYGGFILRTFALAPASPGVGPGIGVHVERRLPVALGLFRSPGFRALSNREQMVARALVEGATHVEIARRLGIRPNTVVSHVRNVYARLEVNSRETLAARLLNPSPVRAA